MFQSTSARLREQAVDLDIAARRARRQAERSNRDIMASRQRMQRALTSSTSELARMAARGVLRAEAHQLRMYQLADTLEGYSRTVRQAAEMAEMGQQVVAFNSNLTRLLNRSSTIDVLQAAQEIGCHLETLTVQSGAVDGVVHGPASQLGQGDESAVDALIARAREEQGLRVSASLPSTVVAPAEPQRMDGLATSGHGGVPGVPGASPATTTAAVDDFMTRLDRLKGYPPPSDER